MGIQIGSMLSAPNGFLNLRKGEIYYFLKSNPNREIVRLVQFVGYEHPSTETRDQKLARPAPIPVLVGIRRFAFEAAVKEGLITNIAASSSMPPWLATLTGKDLVAANAQRKRKRRSHLDIINERLRHIASLLEREDEILCSADPDKAINAHARHCVPKQNETRLRRWFYAYVLFGRNKFALHYSTGRIGKWDRTLSTRQKQGAPSKYFGKYFGHHADAAMRKTILDSYIDRAKQGMSITEMYGEALEDEFKCKVYTDSNGMRSYVQPDGLPFPSHYVYRYHINKELDSSSVRRTKIGPNRERTENQPSKGKFTERVSNLMEIVELDGFFSKELPKGYIDNEPLPPLCEVRSRDTASGITTGIGFSQGSETAAAYQATAFCEAVDKVRFCKLFGIDIEPGDWPSIGRSPHQITDRGVGATPAALPRDREAIPVFRTMTPSYSGQSKAVIESSHPKRVSNKDAPSFVSSNLTPHEMIKRSIFQVLAENERMNVRDRIPMDLIPHVRKTSPIGLWNALDDLGRNDAQTMAFDDAVRCFLPLHDASIGRDGVHFNGQIYHSDQLLGSKLVRQLAFRDKTVKVKVYVLEACVRHIWLEIEGSLAQIDLTIPLRVSDQDLYISLAELKQLHAIQNENEARFAMHRLATETEFKSKYTRLTGKKWDSSVLKPGRPKRGTKRAKQEASEAKRAMSGKLPT